MVDTFLETGMPRGMVYAIFIYSFRYNCVAISNSVSGLLCHSHFIFKQLHFRIFIFVYFCLV